MGGCEGSTGRTTLESLINDIWTESDLTKINSESYYNFFKRFVENDKNLINIDDQDQNIYSVILVSTINKEFFANLKNDILFLANSVKIYRVMIALIFFTKFNNANTLTKSIDKIFTLIKYFFDVKKDIQTDKEFFAEILDVYILICTQLTLKNLIKSDISKDFLTSSNTENLKKYYDKEIREIFINKLIEGTEFFFLSKFLHENIDKINHAYVRDEMKKIYYQNTKIV